MTDWQHHYETGETPWNRGGPSPALVQWLVTHRLSGRVLVPGCGHGHDLVALAGSGAEQVTGLDIAPGGVAEARERTAGLANILVLLGDLFTWCHEEGRGQFDWVFEHTCFCAIPRELRDDYVAAVAAALRPGGHLLAVFYLKPWDEGEDQMQGPPFGSDIEELDRRFGPCFELLDSYVPDVSYSGREGKELLRLLRRK
jgi:SAM-dependent methyltransferase